MTILLIPLALQVHKYALTGIVSNSCNLMGNLELGNSDKFMHYSTSLITVSSSLTLSCKNVGNETNDFMWSKKCLEFYKDVD